jgi:hypothetical protein
MMLAVDSLKSPKANALGTWKSVHARRFAGLCSELECRGCRRASQAACKSRLHIHERVHNRTELRTRLKGLDVGVGFDSFRELGIAVNHFP